MRVSEHGVRAPAPVGDGSAVEPAGDQTGDQTGDPAADWATDWATQTRRVLTRDLLLRAALAQPGESRALQFRALHLNLPLVGEVADRLGLTPAQRRRVEHAALDGLARAIREFDPAGSGEFAEVARSLIEQEIVARRLTPGPSAQHLRRTIRRLMVAKARGRL
jgi:hypothetical protein